MMMVMVMAMIIVAVTIIVRVIVLGVDVNCSGVHPELNASDPFALLTLEMEVVVLEVDFTQLPFECRWRHSEIGQCPNQHISANPREAVQVKNPHFEPIE